MDNSEDQPIRVMLRDHINEQKESNKKLDRLYTAVLGDQGANIEGLVQKVEKHDKWITLDKKVKTFGAGIAAASGTTYGFWDVIKSYFFK